MQALVGFSDDELDIIIEALSNFVNDPILLSEKEMAMANTLIRRLHGFKEFSDGG